MVRQAEEAGLIKSITLEPEDLSQVCTDFHQFVAKLALVPAGMEDDGPFELVHPEKVDARLYPLLRQMAGRVAPGGWLPLPERIAHSYMMYLTRAVSSRRNLATVTDSADEWAIMPYFKEMGNFDERVYEPDANAFYSYMIFSDVLPTNMHGVDPSKIINFTLSRREEKARLRTILQEFSEAISACSSKSHAIEVVASCEKDLNDAKSDYVKSMDFYSPEQGYSLLAVGLPLSLAWYAQFGTNDPYDLLRLSTSVLVGAVAAYADHKKVKAQNRKQSSTSYLFEIDRELSGHSSAPKSHRIFEEFMND
jgi:hypothetical protein